MSRQPSFVTETQRQMARWDQRLSTVFEIARVLVSEGDQETMLGDTLSSLIARLDAADAGSLWLYDKLEECLILTSAHGYENGAVKQLRLAPGEAISGKVFQENQAILCSTPEDTALAMANMSTQNRELFAAATEGLREPLGAIAVPLGQREVPMGVLVLLNLHQEAGFTSGDLEFLQRVADVVTLAVENSRLRDELQVVQALGEANRLKSELISTLAHEMRTPLTSIKGYSTALLLEEANFGTETQREFLQIIDEECDILQDLIHDLLESSIIDAGLLKLELQPVLLPRLVDHILDDMARRTEKHRFVADFSNAFPVIDADPDRIAQVLRNLLDNSIKYSPDGGLIVLRGEVQPQTVIVSVADQGVGIAPEHLNQLFDKYFRAKTGLVQHVVGSGLGLPIAHAIVESHGGRIWAESAVGEGSTFFFTLPRSDVGREKAEQQGDAV